MHNERHFILFMAYLVLASYSFVFLGWPHLWRAMGYLPDARRLRYLFLAPLKIDPQSWPHTSPRMQFILTYILAVALGLAVTVMLTWHLYLVSTGQTSVENHDFDVYKKVAERRKETFVNSWDLG